MGIIGSRDFTNFDFLDKKVNELLPKQDNDIVIVSGGARGTDLLAEKFADKYGYEKDIYRAKWHIHGKCAGYLRNHDVVKNSDFIIAFWDGISKGTYNVVRLAKLNNKPIKIIRIDNLIEK